MQHFVTLSDHKFYVGVCVKLGWQCVAVALQSAPHWLLKAGIWFAGRLNLALPGLNLGHWVTGTHCDWHTEGTNHMYMWRVNLYLHVYSKHVCVYCVAP